MSTSTLVVGARRSQLAQRALDYLELAKPKIVALELVTVAVSAQVAHGGLFANWVMLHALLGTALVGAGASAFNQWLERDLDARMARTADRPLAALRLSGREALLAGGMASLVGCLWLAVWVNMLTAALALATWFLYVAVYTPLKARTPANTVVGAVAGALPVLLGAAAVQGQPSLSTWALFLVVFLWQFPHFMAIAWLYRFDYQAAGLKMWTVVDPSGRQAGARALLFALAIVPVSLLPLWHPGTHLWEACVPLWLSCAQLSCAWTFFRWMHETSARLLLRASLLFLPCWLLWLMFYSLA